MRKKVNLKSKIKSRSRRKFFKARGIGWISIILVVALGSLVVGGFMFIPKTKRTPVTSEYITITQPACEGDNLHACTFIIVTVTPSPRPTRTPNDDDDDNGGGGPGHSPRPTHPGPRPL